MPSVSDCRPSRYRRRAQVPRHRRLQIRSAQHFERDPGEALAGSRSRGLIAIGVVVASVATVAA